GEHALAVLLKVVFEEVPRVSGLRADVPPALDDLVARMLAKAPAERPAGAGEVADALAAIAAAGPTVRPPAARAAARPGGAQRHVSLVLGGGARAGADTLAGGPDDPLAATLDGANAAAPLARVRAAPITRGARIEALLDGSVVVMIPGVGTARDQAARAAA